MNSNSLIALTLAVVVNAAALGAVHVAMADGAVTAKKPATEAALKRGDRS